MPRHAPATFARYGRRLHRARTNVDPNEQELIRRIHADLTDSYDEELELEIDDRVVGDPSGAAGSPDDALKESRRLYFRELFCLWGELVKLQD